MHNFLCPLSGPNTDTRTMMNKAAENCSTATEVPIFTNTKATPHWTEFIDIGNEIRLSKLLNFKKLCT